jgi:hypothetical protein
MGSKEEDREEIQTPANTVADLVRWTKGNKEFKKWEVEDTLRRFQVG